ncbi:lipopolysaccharide biosynthesis protein [Luteibacter sp. 329MFSha]|uniref:lipopolysaccharide biosynthesis protein n=1 Tax=Luteibacter sp. 329MFSha TaxID=1798239 RepID=UPI0008B5458D|nr:lipopolysaccharide biosynthesis protein [Luteibacter sp. 329MFSha]SEW01814.1 Membrane protein involved in the export of O-antigen and teichoic acid [Luteibacter sp. 329MFSha]
MTRSHKTKLGGAARWSGLEIGVRYVVQFGVMVVLARLIDPASFGLVAMVTVFTALGTVFVDSGTGLALIQRQNTTKDEETSTLFVNLAISVVVALVLVGAAPAIASFYGHPELVGLCVAMAAVFPLGALAVVPDALLTQRMAFRTRTRVELVSSTASGVIAIACAYAGLGPWALVAQAISSIGARTAMLYVLSGWRPSGRFDSRAARSVGSFGGYMLVAGLIDTAYNRLQTVWIGRMYSAKELGYYTLAQNTQQAPTSFIAAVLNRLGLPLLSSMRDDLAEARRILRGGMRLGLFIFAPAMATLAALATPLVRTIYGTAWSEAGTLLGILSLAAIPWPAHVLNLVALNSQGHPHLVLRVEVLKKSTGVALLALSAPFGMVAIAWSTVLTSMISCLLNAYFLGRIMNYGVRAQLEDFAGVALPAAIAGLAAWTCRQLIPVDLWAAILGCISAAASTLIVGLALGHPALPTVKQILRGTPT